MDLHHQWISRQEPRDERLHGRLRKAFAGVYRAPQGAPCAGFRWFRLFRPRTWHQWVDHSAYAIKCVQCGRMEFYTGTSYYVCEIEMGDAMTAHEIARVEYANQRGIALTDDKLKG